ncbi:MULTISPECIES: DUF2625 family protein [Pseudomonas]|nr:DUF2625 family protein [Pseudomonas moraviensis]
MPTAPTTASTSPQNSSVLLQLQVTTKSSLGAIAFETGGDTD